MRKIIPIIILFAALINSTYAHPGRLNASGCHNDRSNGTYHCHRSANPTPPAPTITPTPPRINSQDTQRQAQQRPSVYFRNCTEARAAGVTPIRRGEPGYGSHLDRDNDGIACE